MKKVAELYLPLVTKNEFEDIDEEKILSKVWQEKEGSLESVISRIINDTVLEHMRLEIDSTIMQMLFLNDYLINVFTKNFGVLVTNYIMSYLESEQVYEIQEEQAELLQKLVKKVDIKWTIEGLIKAVNEGVGKASQDTGEEGK